MSPRHTTLVALFACSALAGCGLNAVRVDTAGSVAKLSDTVSTQAGAILDNAQKRRTEAFATLVASDASCELVSPLWIYVPVGGDHRYDSPPQSPPAKMPLCADGAAAVNYLGYAKIRINLAPPTQDALRPTLDLIAATSAYGEALAKIVDRPKTDVAKELASALALAEKAQAQATALGISDIPGVPKLSSDQKATATALIQLIVDLAHEARQVKDLKKLWPKYAEKLGRFCNIEGGKPAVENCQESGIYAQLGQQISDWQRIVGASSAQIGFNNLSRAYRDERVNLNFEGRMAFIALIQDAAREPHRVAQADKLFRESLFGLSEANQLLGGQLFNPSAADRAKGTAITRQRIVEALSLILKAISAWKDI